MGDVIYLDHASTTPADPEVVAAMSPWFTEGFGNPSTVYSLGLTSAQVVREARESIAQTIGAEPEEIYFTSGGTESDNWAILGPPTPTARRGAISHSAIGTTPSWRVEPLRETRV